MAATALVHFEIHASDIDRAKSFYEQVFDWKIDPVPGMDYWLIFGGRSKDMKGGMVGIDGGMLRRRGPEPTNGAAVNAFVCTIEVEDINKVTDLILKSGGSLAVEKVAITGMGWLAYCKDTEGNIFGILQPDTAAK